ncbi:hypothetical protein QL285_049381 [Trifolium repens]|nr:hypothetical protein QL285_049381 [Trifolium repens]
MEALKKIATEIGVTLPFKKNPTLTNKNKLNVDQRQHEIETKNCSSVNDAKHDEENQHNHDQNVIEAETKTCSSVDGAKHEEHNQNGTNQNEIEAETKYCSSVNDATTKHEEENQHDHDQNVIKDNYLFDVNEERRRNKYAAAAVLQALELASFEISKYSNHKQKDIVISKRNYRIDLKEVEGKEIKKQYALKEESQLSQNPRNEMKPIPKNATNLVSKKNVEENANRENNTVDELRSFKTLNDNNDHKSESNAARENEDLSEEKTYPSSHAIRWNQQRSQTNHFVRTYFPKKMHTHHEHLDWKMMSVRTR